MYPPDLEKEMFIIEKRTYCYQVMPFRLKNARATYQLMVNKVFKELLGEVMEGYVDDMIVKANKMNHTLDNLKKSLSCLERIICT